MFLRKKIGKQFLAIILAFSLAFNPSLVRVALAEETTVSADPTPQSTITTGNAEATSESSITANSNQNTLPGEITTPGGDCTPPEGETTCPSDINIENDNSATVSGSATGTATTGDNQSFGSPGDALITTGDATASGTIDNSINTNTVTLEPTAPSAASASPEDTETNSLTVNNSNEGELTNTATVSAATGANLATDNAGNTQIETGNALALANIINLLNLNIVGSNFTLLSLNLQGAPEDIDLNELWKTLQEQQGANALNLMGDESNNLQLLIQNQNQANLENNVQVSAASGQNSANENGGNAQIQTGNATALANVTNFVNTNILGSDFFFGTINIFDVSAGNLILPRPEMFEPEAIALPNGPSAVFTNQNHTEISDQVRALAETGANQENNNASNNLLTTGQATAHANIFSLANLNIYHNNWFFLIINNLGQWSGNVLGWSSPGAQESSEEGSQTYELGLGDQNGQGGSSASPQEDTPPSLIFENQNHAQISNNIQTLATTGENQANENGGNSSIQTGNAHSLANLFNLVNLNILASRFFMGVVNILGDWSGDAVFAYPDLTVSVSDGTGEIKPGDTIDYNLCYQNQGYDTATQGRVEFTLPGGMTYLEDSSGLSPQISGPSLSWPVGDVPVGAESCFQIKTQLNSDFTGGGELSFWNKIISPAYAAEEGTTVTVQASVQTSDPESNTSNNSASDTTTVYFPDETDQRQPKLEISAKNNVNEYIFEGDTVTFEILVKNTGNGPSYNTHLTQKLYNGAPEDFGNAEFNLGTIEPGKTGKLTFGIALADHGLLPEGSYHTVAQASGEDANGNKVTSNEARTDFHLRLKGGGSILEVQAAGKEEEVLGSTSPNPDYLVGPSSNNREDILPYVLLFLISSLYLSSVLKPKMPKIQKISQ